MDGELGLDSGLPRGSRLVIWTEWVLATLIGGVGGGVVSLLAAWLVAGYLADTIDPTVVLILAGAAVGAGLGLAQGLVLSRHWRADLWREWTAATVLAVTLVWPLCLFAWSQTMPTSDTGGAPVDLGLLLVASLLGTLLGAAVGGAQWLVLRRYQDGTVGWIAVWVLSGLVGVAGGALLLLSYGELADLVGALGSEQGPAVEDVLPLWVLAGAVACLIAGVVTGLAMLRVVRPRPPAG